MQEGLFANFEQEKLQIIYKVVKKLEAKEIENIQESHVLVGGSKLKSSNWNLNVSPSPNPNRPAHDFLQQIQIHQRAAPASGAHNPRGRDALKHEETNRVQYKRAGQVHRSSPANLILNVNQSTLSIYVNVI